jgi:hypothetical protein
MATPTNRLALLQKNRTRARLQGKFPSASYGPLWDEALRELRTSTMNLLAFDGKRIAIKVALGNHNQVLRGTARYARDEHLGEVMRVELEDSSESGSPAFLFREREWSKHVHADLEHDCEFCIDLTANRDSD